MKNILGIICLLSATAIGSRYEDVQKQLKDIHQNNPEVTSEITLGKNDQGISIDGLLLTFPGNQQVHHLIVGTHHGNEIHAAPTVMETLKELLACWKKSSCEYRSSLQGLTFHIYPVLNISGFNRGSRYERNAAGSSIDPNRDYPDACVKTNYFKLKSTKNLASYLKSQDIVGAVTVHGYIGTFTYPWGIYTHDPKPQDNAEFMKLTKFAAKANGYAVGTHTEVIYPTAGAFEDYAYNELGVWTTLLEISRGSDQKKDALSLVRYFSKVPDQRSKDHRHKGKCSKVDVRSIQARP